MIDVASVAGPALGGGIGLWAVLRFIRWVVEFVFLRLDVSRSHLADRLRHVERELDSYREATMLMIGVVAKLDADNPVLLRVSKLLASMTPHSTLDLNELERRLKEDGGGSC